MTPWPALEPSALELKVRDWTDNNIALLLELTSRRGTLCFDRQGFTYRLPDPTHLAPSTNAKYNRMTSRRFAQELEQLYAEAKPMFAELARRKWWIFFDGQLHLAVPTADSDPTPVATPLAPEVK